MNRMELAQHAQTVIHRDLRNRARDGHPASAVFLPSELLYAVKALPEPALRYTHEDGETMYGVPVIRFESDDMSIYFLATAHYSDGRQEIPEVRFRPYYHNPKEGANYDING